MLEQILVSLQWTHGDFSEFIRQVMLYGFGFILLALRPVGFTWWRYFGTLALMTANEGVARFTIGINPETAWVYCTIWQTLAAAILLAVSITWVGDLIGILFGVSVIGGALTAFGLLDHMPGIGLKMNYWSVMSICSYVMDAVMLGYALAFTGKIKWTIR